MTLTIPTGEFAYVYDAATGNLTDIIAPDGGALSLGYNGSLLTSAAWAGAISGSINYTYNNDFNLTSYDANGNVASIKPQGKPTHTFAYTPADLEETYNPPPVTDGGANQTTYAYNLNRQPTLVIRPDGLTIGFEYDTAGRLNWYVYCSLDPINNIDLDGEKAEALPLPGIRGINPGALRGLGRVIVAAGGTAVLWVGVPAGIVFFIDIYPPEVVANPTSAF